MSLNIRQLTACTNLSTWNQVTFRTRPYSNKTAVEVIMELLANGEEMTVDELAEKGKSMWIGSKAHVGTSVSQLFRLGKLERTRTKKPYKYAISVKP